MVADNHVVTYLHEVIDFRSSADDRWPKGSAVDGDIRADFNIVPNDYAADLRHFKMHALIKDIAEAVRTNDGSGMDSNPIAQFRAGIKNDVGK